MTVFFTDEQGRVRIIPDAERKTTSRERQAGQTENRPVIAESGSVSLRYKPPVERLGERAVGPKSNWEPKLIRAASDQELTNRLWDHFYNGQGQPVEINLNQLDFSENVNVPKLFPKPVYTEMLKPSPNAAKIHDLLPKKQRVEVYSNGKVTHIHFVDPVSNVGLALPTGTVKWAAFGRMALDMQDTEIGIAN